MELLFILAALGLAAKAWYDARQARFRQHELEEGLDGLRADVRALRRILTDLQGDVGKPLTPSAGVGEQEVEKRAEAVAAEPALVSPGVAATAAQPAALAAEVEPSALKPLPPPPKPPIPPARLVPEEAREAGPAEVPPSPPPSITPPPPSPPPSPPLWQRFDWENFIGVKAFSWIGGIALVIAAVFFLRYSIEQGWLSPAVRMAIGLLVGVALLVVCEWKVARRYDITANALDAAGIGILFSTFFAAHALWHLVGMLTAFAMMALVTLVAVVMSIRHGSLFIALLGLLGGFATPALLSTGENRPLGLFTYLLLLNAGLAWVAFRKNWPYLSAAALLFTTLYQWGWVIKFLDSAQMPIAVGVFLVFPVLGTVALMLATRRPREGGERSRMFSQMAAVSAALPLLFAVYGSAVTAYAESYALLFLYLLLVDAGLAAIAIARGQQALHLIGGASTVLVFLIWFSTSYTPAAYPLVLLFVALFVALYGVAGIAAGWLKRPLDEIGARATVAAPVLLFTFAALALVEPRVASPALSFSVLFLLLAGVAAVSLYHERGELYYLSAFFAIAAEGVWSSKYLQPERLTAGLSLYAIFALFYLGVPMLARRWKRDLRPETAGSVILLLSIGLLLYLASGVVAVAALWGMGLLLMVLNLGLFMQGAYGRPSALTIIGTILSWIVIAVWWATATIAEVLVPGLLLVAAFAVLIAAGNLWVQKKTGQSTAAGLYLALAGHLFLFFVAAQPTLSVPPWPMLAVLFVLNLAIGTASLYARTAGIHGAALVASQLVLVTFVMAASDRPWPEVVIASASAVAVFAILWSWLAARVVPASTSYDAAAVVALFLTQAVAVVAGGVAPRIGAGVLSPLHAAILTALLAYSWKGRWGAPAIVSVATSTIASGVWIEMHVGAWDYGLLFSGVVYAVFLAYPAILGRKSVADAHPYQTAVLAGIPFFFLARRVLERGGYGEVIGLLPVTQAVLMALLLWLLLRIEDPAKRMMGRMALVAGAALAFITVAVPLQLEKQWITIGWALLAAALAWLYTRIPHRGLLYWCAGLFVAVVVRLVFNKAVWTYHPRGDFPIWNWYLYTYLVAAVACFVGARWLRATDDVISRISFSRPLTAAGAALLFLLLNIEIADYYSKGPAITFNLSGSLSQDLTYTIGWGIFAIGLLVAGIVAMSRATRITGILLLAATVAKCFLHDLLRLGGLFRIGSLVGLAVCLILGSLALQRFVRREREDTP